MRKVLTVNKNKINYKKKNAEEEKNKYVRTVHFKPLKLDQAHVYNLGVVQSEFERLWKTIRVMTCSKREKDIALQKLQEACNWYCRGIAQSCEEKAHLKSQEKE